MEMTEAKIEVVRSGGELLVRVRVYDGENLVGETVLPGGNLENATAMATGLVSWVESGGDIRAILPDTD